VHTDISSVFTRGCSEIVVDGHGNIYVNSIEFDFLGGHTDRRCHRRHYARRCGLKIRHRSRVSQPHGRHTRQLDADRWRIVGVPP
jgi:hypothetical protein